MAKIAVEEHQSLQETIPQVIAVFAGAGGIIDAEAAIDHREIAVIAVGFAVMAITQLALAGTVLLRPSRPALLAIAALHAGIALTWIMSRTVGIPFIPGAEQPVPVGVADVVANTFSMAVVGLAVVARSLDRADRIAPIPPGAARAIRMTAVAGALILTIAALSAGHEHGHDDSGVSLPGQGHEH
jgi:hypothetical protein